MAQRLGIAGLAVFFALSVTGLSVAAADPNPGQSGVIFNTGSAAYQQSAAAVRAQQYPFGYGYYGFNDFNGFNSFNGFNGFNGYNGGVSPYGFGGTYYNGFNGGTPFFYNNSPNGQTPFTAVGCDTGNFTCLASKGVPYPYGFNGNGFNGFNGNGFNGNGFNGFNGNVYNGFGGGTPLVGFASNYNFSFPYSGLPNGYFTNTGCAVGNYTCLFGTLGTTGTLPNSFFAAVGCPVGNYSCATSQTVFTNNGCTIGNYTCVYTKTGLTP